MTVRSGEAFTKGLWDDREVWYDGRRGGILAGIHREYGRKAHYLDHLDRFLRG